MPSVSKLFARFPPFCAQHFRPKTFLALPEVRDFFVVPWLTSKRKLGSFNATLPASGATEHVARSQIMTGNIGEFSGVTLSRGYTIQRT